MLRHRPCPLDKALSKGRPRAAFALRGAAQAPDGAAGTRACRAGGRARHHRVAHGGVWPLAGRGRLRNAQARGGTPAGKRLFGACQPKQPDLASRALAHGSAGAAGRRRAHPAQAHRHAAGMRFFRHIACLAASGGGHAARGYAGAPAGRGGRRGVRARLERWRVDARHGQSAHPRGARRRAGGHRDVSGLDGREPRAAGPAGPQTRHDAARALSVLEPRQDRAGRRCAQAALTAQHAANAAVLRPAANARPCGCAAHVRGAGAWRAGRSIARV